MWWCWASRAQGVLPVVTQNGVGLQNVAPNVFYLAGRLVDRLWQGILGLVLVFIVQLITQTKKRRTASTSSSSAIAEAGLLLGLQSLLQPLRPLHPVSAGRVRQRANFHPGGPS